MSNAPPGSQSSVGTRNARKRQLDDRYHSRSQSKRRREDEPRDWRDVHLNTSDGSQRRRDGYKERDRERDRGGRGRVVRERSHHSPVINRRPPTPDEREDGEISPQPTPPPATPAPAAAVEPTPTRMDVEEERELDLIPSPPPLEQTLADRRARRAAILARHASGTPNAGSSNGTPGLPSAAPAISKPPSRSPSPAVEQEQDDQFTLAKPDEPAAPSAANDAQVNAADYDPSQDRREDEGRRGVVPVPVPDDDDEEEEDDDDEDEDVDDMFAFASSPKEKKKKTGKKKAKVVAAPTLAHQILHSDTASDPEGYYNVILGEVITAPSDGERYQVYASVGRGMFAVVVRARVLAEGNEEGAGGREVAIKIVRSQEVMHRAGLKEAAILNKLQAADPEDKKHLVRLERTFEHRGHFCLVFESLSMNLRDVVKRFGKDVGLNIRAVRAYAQQLFIALSHLRKLGVMHADIKPDNILVNESKTLLKLCDLGSASDAAENEITPYLVSRFYRAPEIILGVPYDPSLDMWSVGCTLYELYTGKILFPGRSNNQMLLHMMELRGRFNSKMIKRAKFGDVYFDELGAFESVAGGNDVPRKVHIQKPTRDLRARLMGAGGRVRLSDEETTFVDLLERCLALDPARRITPREALGHAFIRGLGK